MSRVIATVALGTLMLARTFAQDGHQLHGKNASSLEQQIKEVEDQNRDAMLKGDSSLLNRTRLRMSIASAPTGRLRIAINS